MCGQKRDPREPRKDDLRREHDRRYRRQGWGGMFWSASSVVALIARLLGWRIA